MLSKFCLRFVVWLKKLQTQRYQLEEEEAIRAFLPSERPPLHFWSPRLGCQEAPFAMTGKMLWTEMGESARSVDIGLCYVFL